MASHLRPRRLHRAAELMREHRHLNPMLLHDEDELWLFGSALQRKYPEYCFRKYFFYIVKKKARRPVCVIHNCLFRLSNEDTTAGYSRTRRGNLRAPNTQSCGDVLEPRC